MGKIQKAKSIESSLGTISAKVMAIGELIKFRGGEPSLDDEMVNFGIGEILTVLAAEMVRVMEDAES